MPPWQKSPAHFRLRREEAGRAASLQFKRKERCWDPWPFRNLMLIETSSTPVARKGWEKPERRRGARTGLVRSAEGVPLRAGWGNSEGVKGNGTKPREGLQGASSQIAT